MNLKFKLTHEDSIEPKYSRNGDACFDLYCRNIKQTTNYIEYFLGVAFQIQLGYVGLIYPRSSITNYDLFLKNSVGVIDPNYRGEVSFRCAMYGNLIFPKLYKVGDKCAQMRIALNPTVKLNKVEQLSESNRGVNGYGSSGK